MKTRVQVMHQPFYVSSLIYLTPFLSRPALPTSTTTTHWFLCRRCLHTTDLNFRCALESRSELLQSERHTRLQTLTLFDSAFVSYLNREERALVRKPTPTGCQWWRLFTTPQPSPSTSLSMERRYGWLSSDLCRSLIRLLTAHNHPVIALILAF